MIIDKDKFPTEVDHIVHSVHDGENLLHLVHIPLVRCKDCKYWEKEYDEYDGEEWWTCGKYEPYNSNDSMHEDDFCSRGERK